MDALNVLIVGTAYVDKHNMNPYDKWFDKKVLLSSFERRRLVGSGIRESALTATYSLLDLDKFPAHVIGNTPDIMVDYGADDGRVGFNLAVAMDVGKLVTVNGRVDDLIASSSKVTNIESDDYMVPTFIEKPDLFVLNDVVSWMGNREKMLQMFIKMAGELSEKGIVLVVQTDSTPVKIKNVRENFEFIKKNNPDLLRKILFVLPKESVSDTLSEDIVLSAFEGDLASQLAAYRESFHDKEFVINDIRETR